MNIRRTMPLFTIFFACQIAACSGSKEGDGARAGGASGEVAAARARLLGAPSGALTKASASRVAAALRRDTASGEAASSLAPTGGGKGGSKTASMRPLSVVPLSQASLDTCADIEAKKEVGSCACESGEMRYAIPNIAALASGETPDEVDMRFEFAACRLGGKVADGLLAVQTKKAKGGASEAVFVADMTIDEDAIEVAFAVKDGKLWYAEDVDDDGGYVLVELGGYADGTGGYQVHADNGEFTCELDDGEGACEHAESGDVLAVDEDEAR